MRSARSWSLIVLALVSCGALGAMAAPGPHPSHATVLLRQAALLRRPSQQVAPLPPLPSGRQLHWRAERPHHVYPPLRGSVAGQARAPIVMMLHGMCSDPLGTCDFWSTAGREGSFMVCPTGNGHCGQWADWTGSGEIKARHLDQVLAEVEEHYGPHLAEPGQDVLIGFSRGAFVARDVAYARPGRYRGVIFIGAAFTPDADRLRASGIRRVVFAAGQYDCARPTMQLAAARMNTAGLPSRYVSLGPIYHQLPADLETILREQLDWIRQAL